MTNEPLKLVPKEYLLTSNKHLKIVSFACMMDYNLHLFLFSCSKKQIRPRIFFFFNTFFSFRNPCHIIMPSIKLNMHPLDLIVQPYQISRKLCMVFLPLENACSSQNGKPRMPCLRIKRLKVNFSAWISKKLIDSFQYNNGVKKLYM